MSERLRDLMRRLRGMSCEHKRMRYASCQYCKKRKMPCRVECPDCGLTWELYEGTDG